MDHPLQGVDDVQDVTLTISARQLCDHLALRMGVAMTAFGVENFDSGQAMPMEAFGQHEVCVGEKPSGGFRRVGIAVSYDRHPLRPEHGRIHCARLTVTPAVLSPAVDVKPAMAVLQRCHAIFSGDQFVKQTFDHSRLAHILAPGYCHDRRCVSVHLITPSFFCLACPFGWIVFRLNRCSRLTGA